MVKNFKHIVLEVTNKCNLLCTYCYVSSGNTFINPPINNLLAIASRLKELEVEEVLLCGGEPTAHPDLVLLLDHCKQIDLKISISTNGIINRNQAKLISDYCFEVDVSIRGANKTQFETITTIPGSYNAVLSGLEHLKNTGVRLNINYDLTKTNYNYVYDTIANLVKIRKISIRKIWIQRTSLQGRAIYNKSSFEGLDLEKYIHVLKSIRAIDKEFGIKSRFIDPLPLCLIEEQYHEYILDSRYGYDWGAVDTKGVLRRDPVDLDPRSQIGSIFNDEIIKQWNESEYLKKFRELKWLPDNCQSCKRIKKCKGGFIASSPPSEEMFSLDLLLTENIDKLNPFR